MKLSNLFAVAAMAVCVSTTASAQNLQLNEAPTIRETATSQWVVDVFQGTPLTATVVVRETDHETVQVIAPSGASFFISLLGCDTTTPKNCGILQPFAFFDATGVTLNQINSMVRDNFALSHAYLDTDGDGVLITKIVLVGGVADKNDFEELGAFLIDIDNLISAISTGPRAEVSFEEPTSAVGKRVSKVQNGLIASGDYVVNKVGPNAPKFLTEETKAFFD